MATIYVDGKDRTAQLSDWTLSNHVSKGLQLTCHFHSGKSYSSPFSACRVVPSTTAKGTLLVRRDRGTTQEISRAEIIGNKYALIYFPNNDTPYVMKADAIEILPASALKSERIFSYFSDVAAQRQQQASADKQPIASNIVRQLEQIPAHPDTVLEAYCHGKNQTRKKPAHFIYPFGLNESQLAAVEQAFSAQLSVIEGPPGTGKTQTILNIVANILLQKRSVAIVSNNNTAVDNVYEKLKKVDLDYVVARLGSKDNRLAFFASQPAIPRNEQKPAVKIEVIADNIQQLKKHLNAQNNAARLRAEIDELGIEARYLTQWQQSHNAIAAPEAARYRLTQRKLTDLMVFTRALTADKIRLRERIKLLFNFGIFNIKPFASEEKRQSMVLALQHQYYATRLAQAQNALAECEHILRSHNIADIQQRLTEDSMDWLRAHLARSISGNKPYAEDNYKKDFANFLQRYPIISSSTHSIINSLANGALLDYVIIDEASQQDIIPGILAFACARNVIVVGDRKQLSHVPEKTAITAPLPQYDCISHSLLDSLLAVYDKQLPVTLLKEHYRCHPKIIQFCNKQFYNNQLIPMTRDNGEAALSLVITAKGNHARANANLRELESLSVLNPEEAASRGFISPYNAQIKLAQQILGEGFDSSTVHKFQGRECEQIFFSTVLDKNADEESLNFVDDPQLVNVAVSRAQKHFTLVTGDNVFSGSNRHIAALIRYMLYYADNQHVHYSPLVSAFDLLYEEYDRSLEALRAKLRPEDSAFVSEQIAAQLIRQVLGKTAFSPVTVHSQIMLRQLITHLDGRFSHRQQEFMLQGASCDFVFYYRVGKQPFAVIEVDGKSHQHPDQAERDALKDAILQTSGIALLRLRTIDSQPEEKIAEFLHNAIERDAIDMAAVSLHQA